MDRSRLELSTGALARSTDPNPLEDGMPPAAFANEPTLLVVATTMALSGLGCWLGALKSTTAHSGGRSTAQSHRLLVTPPSVSAALQPVAVLREPMAAVVAPTPDVVEPTLLIVAPEAEHAHRLLLWLQGAGGVSGEILSTELVAIYHEMCAEHRLQPRSWLRIGRAFRELTGGHKGYVWAPDERGIKHRLRRYVVPPAPEGHRLQPDEGATAPVAGPTSQPVRAVA